MNKCPNCGDYVNCKCSWPEKIAAEELLRKRDHEMRRKEGKPVIVDLTGD